MRALADDWESTRLERYQKVNRVPAVIAVVNSVRNALVLYKWIAGSRDGQSWNPGAIDCFSNVDPTTNETTTHRFVTHLDGTQSCWR